MPRINEDFLDSVIYLYRSEHEAKEGINIGGSGFLVSIPSQRVDGRFVFAVTNRHVIANADVLRLNTKEGRMHVERAPREQWICSPTDDLAVICIDLDDEFTHKTINVNAILTEEMAYKRRLGIGDNVFMVGRFINHEGKQQNAPLVRFGSIAQMPSEPIQTEICGKLHEQISIVADIRSIGGYSGSPVFLNEFSFLRRPGGGEPAKNNWLIGVDWGHIKMWSPVCGLNEEPIGIGHQVNINSGMAGIVPAWKLLDLLMSDDMKKQIREAEDLHLSAKKSIAGAADIATSPAFSPATDENPTHREDFTRLVGAAARKREQED
jgi:hypothetical protein